MMRLALSNIGFAQADTPAVYAALRKDGFTGLEIAPSIFAGENPYACADTAAQAAQALSEEYGLVIASMQSIWYGQQGNIFETADAARLAAYTKKAVCFAKAVGCKNLVFGCPKNRNIPSGGCVADARPFFAEIAKAAAENETCIALEANPAVYGTNFCNTSEQAFAFARSVPHLKVNYDLGTLLTNGESLQTLADSLPLVNHIHLSEPQLAPLALTAERRALYRDLAALLHGQAYGGFVSIEMKTQPFATVERILAETAEVFA